jgi:hypothetical protein
MIIHYHKTGAFITHSLLQFLNKFAFIQTTPGDYPKRRHDKVTKCPKLSIQNSSTFIQTAPDLFCDVDTIIPANTRILHFFRDPYDMALSNYLYHSQNPTPEKWVLEHNPCLYNEESVELVLSELDLSRDVLQKVIDMCYNYTANNPMQYYRHLRSLPTYDGLRLATAQQTIEGRRGMDILRMPNNMRRLQRAKADVMLLDMSDWLENPRETTLKGLNFLYGPFISEQTKLKIANAMVGSFASNKVRPHYTHGKLKNDDRVSLVERLSRDDTLGPVLKKMKRISEEVASYQTPG